jgi:ribonuclease P protein component
VIRKSNRFHGHNSVRKVRGSVEHGQNLSLRAAKNPKRSDYRLAVVVSKKVAPRAVTRNRIRRRLFEIVRTQKRFQGTPLDLVLYVKKPEVSKIAATELANEVLSLSKKTLSRTSR